MRDEGPGGPGVPDGRAHSRAGLGPARGALDVHAPPAASWDPSTENWAGGGRSGSGASPSLAADLLCALSGAPSCLSCPSCKPTQRTRLQGRSCGCDQSAPMGTQVFATFTNLQSACCVSDIEFFIHFTGVKSCNYSNKVTVIPTP